MQTFSRVYSAQTHLLSGKLVTIEVDLSRGLHNFSIVGLPDKAVEESRDRVGSAIKNSGLESPKNKNQKIVVSLSPADLKKEGPYFDLAIALGYLLSTGDILFDPDKKLFLGELSLNGDVRPIKGVLPLTQEAKRLGFTEIYVPEENAREGSIIEGITVYGVKTLREVIDHLNTNIKNGAVKKIIPTPKTMLISDTPRVGGVDFEDIRGQEAAKRGLEIAAAGGHNIAMSGPPGTGKTMLARAFAALLPKLTLDEALEVTGIHSIAGDLETEIILCPPFRSPHHTASYVSIIGGGTFPKPGEVTLAHRGVLFLDEFPEFEKRVIESLRQPLEDNVVSISRAKGSALFPSNFILIAAMNPCPCGNLGNKQKSCICTPHDLARYSRRLSGPIMDRIDLWVTVGTVEYAKLAQNNTGVNEKSEAVEKRIAKARSIQRKRFKNNERPIKTNSDMNVKELSRYVRLADAEQQLLRMSAEKLDLSARAYHRVLKLARTIADLDGSEEIKNTHILEALQYRPKTN